MRLGFSRFRVVSLSVFNTTAIALTFALGGSMAMAQDTYSGVFFTGIDGYKSGVGTYGGYVYALNGDIASTGWTVSTSLGFSKSWDNSTTPSGSTISSSATVVLGHQWHTDDYYFTIGIGPDVINNEESPSTGSPTEGFKAGAALQLGFETKAADAMYFQGFATYLTAYERRYAQLRVGYQTASYMTFGLEGVYSKEFASDQTTRLGLFVGGIAVGNGSMGFSVGYQNGHGSTVSDGAYLAVEYSIPLRF